MSNLTIQDVHDNCLIRTQRIIKKFGWHDIEVTGLTDDDAYRLCRGIPNSRINWRWGMATYAGYPNDGILDIKLKISSRKDPDGLHAVILCKYDEQQNEFGIGMLENFLATKNTVLTGKVFLIALVYSTLFCPVLHLDEIYIYDPHPELVIKYESYGFSLLPSNHKKMSSPVTDVLETISRKVMELPG